jgi:hypothetical protein
MRSGRRRGGRLYDLRNGVLRHIVSKSLALHMKVDRQVGAKVAIATRLRSPVPFILAHSSVKPGHEPWVSRLPTPEAHRRRELNGAGFSEATGINALGVIVGLCVDSSSNVHEFIRTP